MNFNIYTNIVKVLKIMNDMKMTRLILLFVFLLALVLAFNLDIADIIRALHGR